MRLKIDNVVNNKIDALNVYEYKLERRASTPISYLNSYICQLLPVIKFADASHRNLLLQKVSAYLSDNYEALKKDDSDEILGDLRAFARVLIYNICGTIFNAGIESYNNKYVESFYYVLKKYVLCGFQIKRFLALTAKKISKLGDIEPLVVSDLFTGNISGTVDNLSALSIIMSNEFDGGLMTKVESYIEFSNSEDVPAYIDFIKAIVKDGTYPLKFETENKLRKIEPRDTELKALLMNLKNKVDNLDIISLIADIEFETLRLVQQIIINHPTWKDNEAVEVWKKINDDKNTFNDVRLKD